MVYIVLFILLKLNIIGEVYDISEYDKEQYKLINEYRVENDLQPFQWSTELYILAKEKTEHMLKFDYFDHTSPAGITLYDRLRQTHGKAENIAKDFDNAIDCINALKESPTHNYNLIDERSMFIGIYTQDGYTTQIFGDNTISP